MQQIAILNYATGTVDIYTTDESADAEEYITINLGLRLNDILYMSKPGIIPVTIYSDD